MTPLLQAMPVRVILDDTCALLGAAAFAEARSSEVSGHSERAASFSVRKAWSGPAASILQVSEGLTV